MFIFATHKVITLEWVTPYSLKLEIIGMSVRGVAGRSICTTQHVFFCRVFYTAVVAFDYFRVVLATLAAVAYYFFKSSTELFCL